MQSYKFKGFDVTYQIESVQGNYDLSDSIFYMFQKLVHRVITLNPMACRHQWELNGSNITNVQNINLGFFQNHIRVFWLSPLLIIPTSNYCAICTKLLHPCTLVGFFHSVHCFRTYQEIKIHPFSILFLSIHSKIVPQCKARGKVITVCSILIPCILIKCSQHCFMYKCNIARNQHFHLPIFSPKYIITSQKIGIHTKTTKTR